MTALDYYRITTHLQQGFFESVCIKRTKEVSFGGVVFNYAKISPRLYFGFSRAKGFFIASPEKAFLDAVYLKMLGRYKLDETSIDYSKFNLDSLKKLANKFPKKVQLYIKKYV